MPRPDAIAQRIRFLLAHGNPGAGDRIAPDAREHGRVERTPTPRGNGERSRLQRGIAASRPRASHGRVMGVRRARGHGYDLVDRFAISLDRGSGNPGGPPVRAFVHGCAPMGGLARRWLQASRSRRLVRSQCAGPVRRDRQRAGVVSRRVHFLRIRCHRHRGRAGAGRAGRHSPVRHPWRRSPRRRARTRAAAGRGDRGRCRCLRSGSRRGPTRSDLPPTPVPEFM